MFFKSIIFVFISILANASKSQIQGNWTTSCLNGVKKWQSYQNNLNLTREHFFADRHCQNPSVSFETEGSVSFPPENLHYIDFIYETIYLTLHQNSLVDDFNTRRVCGFDDWRISEARNITNLNCALFSPTTETEIPAAGDRRYGIYLREENQLYYGQLSFSTDGTTPEKRPREFNRLIEYTSQKLF